MHSFNNTVGDEPSAVGDRPRPQRLGYWGQGGGVLIYLSLRWEVQMLSTVGQQSGHLIKKYGSGDITE